MTTTAMTTTTSRRPPLSLSGAHKPLSFIRAAFAVVQGGGNSDSTEAALTRMGDVAAAIIVNKGDASVATTADSGWASELAAESFGAFLSDLQPYSGAARLIAKAVQADLGSSILYNYPIRTGSPHAPAWVSEGGAIEVRTNPVSSVELGPRRHLASLVFFSNELSLRSDAFEIFTRLLKADLACGIDGAFFSTSAGSASVHQGLMYNVTATTPSGAGGKAAMEEDLSNLASAVSVGGSGNVVFAAPPELVARLRIGQPALAAAIDIAPSNAIASGRICAVDPSAVLVHVGEMPEISIGEHATLHMSDTAGEIVSAAGSVSDPIRSAFQTSSTALWIVQQLAFARTRTSAAAFIDGANWA